MALGVPAYLTGQVQFAFADYGAPVALTFAQCFAGRSYLAPLATEPIPTFNVTFELGCRNNWRIHHADAGGGQLLICVHGKGWYQERGGDARPPSPGGVVVVPPNVERWHGAAAGSWLQHVAQEVPGENASTEWLEPVDDARHGALTAE